MQRYKDAKGLFISFLYQTTKPKKTPNNIPEARPKKTLADELN